MKIRNGFVSNSSSSSFMIINKTDSPLSIHDFVKEIDAINYLASQSAWTKEEIEESFKNFDQYGPYMLSSGKNVSTFQSDCGDMGDVALIMTMDNGLSETFSYDTMKFNPGPDQIETERFIYRYPTKDEVVIDNMEDILLSHIDEKYDLSKFKFKLLDHILDNIRLIHNRDPKDKDIGWAYNCLWECVESSVWCHVFDQSLASDQIERACHKNADGVISALRKERDQIQNQLVEIILEKE